MFLDEGLLEKGLLDEDLLDDEQLEVSFDERLLEKNRMLDKVFWTMNYWTRGRLTRDNRKKGCWPKSWTTGPMVEGTDERRAIGRGFS